MENAFERVERAARWEDVFGTLPEDVAEALRLVALRFRELGREVHPDRHRGPSAGRAHEAFVKLARLRSEAERAVRKEAEALETIVATRRRAYRVGGVVLRDDLCDLHACRFEDGDAERSALFKLAHHPDDDDLVEAEARILERLRPRGSLHEKFFRYLPELVDSFRARLGDVPRRLNVLAVAPGHVSLEDVRAAHPRGLDYRDVAWIWKRMLVGLGFVHRHGIVHGAVLPSTVRVHPIHHGAQLASFCWAVPAGEAVRARVPRYQNLYAPEIGERRPATPSTDIFMASRCVEWLLDDEAPMPVRTFLRTCVAPSPRRRPDDAWALHDELDALLRKLVGPPCYRPLRMPPAA